MNAGDPVPVPGHELIVRGLGYTITGIDKGNAWVRTPRGPAWHSLECIRWDAEKGAWRASGVLSYVVPG